MKVNVEYCIIVAHCVQIVCARVSVEPSWYIERSVTQQVCRLTLQGNGTFYIKSNKPMSCILSEFQYHY